MAGILSIASGIISVLQAAERLSDLLKKVEVYRAASDEILALSNEVEDIRLILDEHNHIVEELNHIRDVPRARLRRFLDDTEIKILQIESLIKGILIQNNLKHSAMNKISWVRKKPEVEMMRKELRDLRRNITDHFAVINL